MRIVARIFVASSLLLLVIAVVLWVRGYWAGDRLWINSQLTDSPPYRFQRVEFRSSEGGIAFVVSSTEYLYRASKGRWGEDGIRGIGAVSSSPTPYPGMTDAIAP